jgi:hypothetical protein
MITILAHIKSIKKEPSNTILNMTALQKTPKTMRGER